MASWEWSEAYVVRNFQEVYFSSFDGKNPGRSETQFAMAHRVTTPVNVLPVRFSMFVAPTSVVTLDVDPDGPPAVLCCDGRRYFTLPPGSSVEVVGGATPVRLARLNVGSFTERLVRKFELPVQGWRTRRDGDLPPAGDTY